MAWKRFRIIALACFTLVFAFGESAIGEDAILSTVHKNLYTAREDAIRLLEDSLRQDSSNVDYWIALIHALDVNSQPQFADCAARLALRIHPLHPELMIARARVLSKAAAWDQLDDLGRLQGQEERALQLKEWLELDLLYFPPQPLPSRWMAGFHAHWATRLLERNPGDRIVKIVADGLKINPHEARLRKLVPFADVYAGRYEEALKAQAEQEFPQTQIGQLMCLADAFLLKEEPRHAIRSFGGTVPEDPDLRRILAMAHAGAKEYDKAEKLLKQTAEDDLLRINFDVARGREQSVKKRVPDLLKRHCTRGPGSWAAPTYGGRGGSCGRAYRQAITWLLREFPDNEKAIYAAFGAAEPRNWLDDRWLPDEDIRRSARRYTAWLQKGIPQAPEEDRVEMRRVLAGLLADQHQFAEAAKVLAPNAAMQGNAGMSVNGDAVRWSLLRRRADAEKLHQSQPWKLVEARRLLAEFRCRTFNSARIGKTPWRKPDVLVSLLQEFPSGILAAVFDTLKPQVITGDDRTPYIAVIRTLGAAEDAPVLINTLWMTVRGEPSDDNRRSAEELHECLERLTGTDGPDGSPQERAEFWLNWWRENAVRILK